MTGNNHIIRAVEGEPADVSEAAGETTREPAIEAPLEDSRNTFDFDEGDEFEAPSRDWSKIILGGVCVVAILGWTGLYGWAIAPELSQAVSAAPGVWTRWIIDWSVPVLLVCVIWLLAMRNSTREAKRFARTAATLSEESAQLENRLSVVNRELSLAREFLASQSRDLEALGRIAAERLSTNAEELQSLIKTNGQQVENIGTASDTALANMTRLRDDLPVIATSARDVNNQVGSTGRTAREQLDKLVEGFERLNTFGKASETQVSALTAHVGATIQGFEGQLGRIEEKVRERFEAAQSQTNDYSESVSTAEEQALTALKERVTLLKSETDAIANELQTAQAKAVEQVADAQERWEQSIRETLDSLDKVDQQNFENQKSRLAAILKEADRFDSNLKQRDMHFMEEMNRRQSDFDTREAQATEVLSQRLNALDDALAEKREAHLAETQKLNEQSDQMAAQLDKLSAMISAISNLGADTRKGLSEGLDVLGERLEAKRATLIETDANLTALTDASVRLLEIIQSGAKHSREDLPDAINTASEQLSRVERRATGVSEAMMAMGQKGDELSSYLIKTNEGLSHADTTLEALQARVAERSEEAMARLDSLKSGLEEITTGSETLAGETQDALVESIRKLEGATEATLVALDEGARGKVEALAQNLSQEAVSSLEKALRTDTAEAIGALEQAAAHASGVGREATVQLRDQLALVNELTGNLEQRINRARELAEEQVDNDFARRMALITDSLNSASIDISNALSTEVSDAAWDSYLKGDRGIFTRRAVRLLDAGDVKGITDLYQYDDTFKANVNRYIHDFEAMLRSMLSTRDGNALSVTILGSDMGKLYVALAQAIERLRK
ncbi:MAG: ATPase [Pseudomonadota bacterium]